MLNYVDIVNLQSKYIHWHGFVLMYFLDGAHCHFFGFFQRCHWIAINWRFHGQLNFKVIKRLDSIIVVQQFCNNEVEWTVKLYFDKRKKHLYLIFIYLDFCIPLLTISKLRTSPFLKLFVIWSRVRVLDQVPWGMLTKKLAHSLQPCTFNPTESISNYFLVH